MSLFQQAAILNNEGVSFLLEGDHKAAITAMGQAVKLMQVDLTNRRVGGGACSSSSSVTRIQPAQTVEISMMESSDTIVFNQAVRIPADAAALPSDVDLNVYISSVIFNLALAHNFLASGSAVSMKKAEKLYIMVLRLLNDVPLAIHIALVVKLACISNLSQIRYSNGQYKLAQEGLDEVTMSMRQSSNHAMFEDSAIQGLLMNVFLLKAPVAAKAA